MTDQKEYVKKPIGLIPDKTTDDVFKNGIPVAVYMRPYCTNCGGEYAEFVSSYENIEGNDVWFNRYVADKPIERTFFINTKKDKKYGSIPPYLTEQVSCPKCGFWTVWDVPIKVGKENADREYLETVIGLRVK